MDGWMDGEDGLCEDGKWMVKMDCVRTGNG
jgi:hypothetical protein